MTDFNGRTILVTGAGGGIGGGATVSDEEGKALDEAIRTIATL